ncbi:hypothetical protein QJS10_CPA03g00814 [Acorus calamus]|uniref:Reverse transcriptase n=1 Tax=Acorus calamus TaxID=4465 RepID=A0AAV9F6E8_ACOCL|nr:hypothetical protein QJS10_CPA03g00814 [Acorus calamus]
MVAPRPLIRFFDGGALNYDNVQNTVNFTHEHVSPSTTETTAGEPDRAKRVNKNKTDRRDESNKLVEDSRSGWTWSCSRIYGPHDGPAREDMWDELSAVKREWGGPWCCMGDFNVTRWIEDRNRRGGISRDMRLFSDWIETEGLLDLPLMSQAYTWSSLREHPSLARLDRVWIQRGSGKFLDSPDERHPGSKEAYLKLKRLKHTLKGWSREAKQKRVERKSKVALDIALYDAIEESGLMGEVEREARISLKGEMQHILGQEEEEWRLGSRAIWLKEGDNNTSFFHKIANQRRRANQINTLMVEGTRITSEAAVQDDTAILCPREEQCVEGVMFVVTVFGWLSGLSINLSKSAIFGIHMGDSALRQIVDCFSCPVESFPTRYLGLPLSLRPLANADWAPLVHHFKRRLEGWAGRLLSSGGRLVLLQAVLSNLPVFMLSIFKLPRTILQRLDTLRR